MLRVIHVELTSIYRMDGLFASIPGGCVMLRVIHVELTSIYRMDGLFASIPPCPI